MSDKHEKQLKPRVVVVTSYCPELGAYFMANLDADDPPMTFDDAGFVAYVDELIKQGRTVEMELVKQCCVRAREKPHMLACLMSDKTFQFHKPVKNDPLADDAPEGPAEG